MAPAVRQLCDAANPTRREYDEFIDVISARAAIGRDIPEEEVDSRIIFPVVHMCRGMRTGGEGRG